MIDQPIVSEPVESQERAASRVWQRVAPLVFATLSIGLAARGQQIFNEGSNAVVREGMLYFLAAALFFYVATLLSSPVPFRLPGNGEEGEQGRSLAWGALPLWRIFLAFASIVLTGGVLYALSQVPREPQLPDYSPYVLRWLGAILLMILAFYPAQGAQPALLPRLRAALGARRGELAVLLAVVLLGAFLRLWALGAIPGHLNGDEASIGMDVQRILQGQIRDPFGLMWGPLPAMSGFVIAGFYQLFGQTVAGLRLPGAVAGVFAAGALYLLARGFLRREAALGAAMLLAAMPLHIHYSRIAVNTAWDSFFFTAALAALFWAVKRPGANHALFLLAGLLAGFGQYAYSGSRLLPVLMAGFLGAVLFLSPKRLRGKWTGILGMAALVLVVASPLYLHAYRYPDDFNARFNQTGIFQTGYVEQEKVLRGTDTLGVLVEQFRRALLGFAFLNDTTETWGSGTPLLPPLFSVALFFGLLLSLRRWREPATALMHGWFWAVLIGAGVLTTNPPASNRLTSVLPVVALFAAIGWERLAAALAPNAPDPTARRRWRDMILVALVVLTAATGIRAYQGYLAGNDYGGVNAKIATLIGRELAQRPAGTTYIALTSPRMFAGMSPIAFQAPAAPARDISTTVATLPPDLPAGDLLVVALPERVSELAVFQQAFAAPPATEVRDPGTGAVLYYSLWIDR